jgi:adenylyl- and sulfurtransferase ThiI/cysteine sulfinate desulfinase/cysteine desulfurase-like protein
MTEEIINLDHMANTPMLEEVNEFMTNNYKFITNSNSLHKLGIKTKLYLDQVEQKLDTMFNYNHKYFIPGGGTCANKRSILGSIPVKPKTYNNSESIVKKDIILVSSIEHSSIIDYVIPTLTNMEYTVELINVDKAGKVSVDHLIALLEKYKTRVALVSIMYVNNETGIIQPIEKVIKIVKQSDDKILVHSDIAQGVGLFLNNKIKPDIISFSTYKFGGTHMGIVCSENKLNDDYFGTADVMSMYGGIIALETYQKNFSISDYNNKIFKENITKQLFSELEKNNIKFINISSDNSINNAVSFLLPGYQTKVVQQLLSAKDICIGVGSACQSTKAYGSHVVKAMGYYNDLTFSLIRLSFDNSSESIIHEFINEFISILLDLKILIDEPKQIFQSECKNSIFKPVAKKGMRLNTSLLLPLLDNEFNNIKVSVGESFLKGGNRKIFITHIINDIKRRLGNNDVKIMNLQSHLVVSVNDNPNVSITLKDIMDVLQNIPGISVISPMLRIKNGPYNDKSADNLLVAAATVFSKVKKNNIKADVKLRSMSSFGEGFGSMEWNSIIGQYLVDRFNCKINLSNPDLKLFVDIGKDYIDIYHEKIKCLSGLPLNSEGNITCFVDGSNINRSLVACYMISTRGVNVKCMVTKEIINDDGFKKFMTCIRIINPKVEYIEIDNPSVIDIENCKTTIILIENKTDMPVFYANQLKDLGKKTNKMIISLTMFMDDNEIDKKLEIYKFSHIKTDARETIFSELFIRKHENENKKERILSMISGGIDSPVASKMLVNNGIQLDYIHFTTHIDKTKNIKDIIKKVNPDSANTMFVVEFKDLQDEIVKVCKEEYRTILYKIFMVKIANEIAKRESINAVAMGNSWGQVASQTPENIYITDVFSDIPVISPLLAMSKDTIIELATKYDTYTNSICDGTSDCCVMYLPKHPVLKASKQSISKYIAMFPNFMNQVNIITVNV